MLARMGMPSMPRDALPPPAAAEINLPGGRRGKVIAADDAGEFRIALQGHDWISRLAAIGWLDRNQVEAAGRLRELFDQSGIRPRVGGSYQAPVDAFSRDFMLEGLDDAETAAWRRLGRLLGSVPPECRCAVEDGTLWDRQPGSLERLCRGLDAVARAMRQPRRRR